MSNQFWKTIRFGSRIWYWLVSCLFASKHVPLPSDPSMFEKAVLIEKYGFNRYL
jgi:hypothetical protein